MLRTTASTVLRSAPKSAKSMSATKALIRSMASSISSIRMSQSLGRYRLLEDALAELLFQAIAGHEVHRQTQQLLQVLFDRDQLEQPDRLAELDQQIDIAFGTRLIARRRSEDSQRCDSQFHQLSTMLSQRPKHVIASHDFLPIVSNLGRSVAGDTID